MEFKEKVRAILKKKSWSSADLAKRCNVSRRTVEGWRIGRPASKKSQDMIETIESLIEKGLIGLRDMWIE